MLYIFFLVIINNCDLRIIKLLLKLDHVILIENFFLFNHIEVGENLFVANMDKDKILHFYCKFISI